MGVHKGLIMDIAGVFLSFAVPGKYFYFKGETNLASLGVNCIQALLWFLSFSSLHL